MTFCYRNEVDIVVFPENSIPIGTLYALRDFAARTTVIAGLGYLQRSDIEALHSLDIDVSGVSQGNNVAVVLSQSKNSLVTKINPTDSERIQAGSGPKSFVIPMLKGTFTVGVAICLDFLLNDDGFFKDNPDLVAIPALTENEEDYIKPSKNFLRVFANHASYGGTYIGAPEIKSTGFTNSEGTLPLPAGTEGIVIVNWDFPEKRTRTPRPDYRLFARAALVYKGRDEEIAQTTSLLETPLGEDLRTRDLLKVGRQLRLEIEQTDQRYVLLSQAIEAIEAGHETYLEEELRAIMRHCILSSDVYELSEWRYSQSILISQCLKRHQDSIPEVVAVPFAFYETIAREEARQTRSKLLAPRHKAGPILPLGSQTQDSQLVLYATLGSYGDEAANSSGRQLTLLRTFAELQKPNIKLAYRLRTERDKNNKFIAVWEVLCTTKGYSQDEVEDLRESIGQLIHTTFVGVYSISYTLRDATLHEAREEIVRSQPWWSEIRRVRNSSGEPIQFQGFTDWALIIDFIRSLDQPIVLELQCAPKDDGSSNYLNVQQGGSESTFHVGSGLPGVPTRSANTFFDTLFESAQNDHRHLTLRILVGSTKALPQPVVDCIGVELAGGAPYEVVNSDDPVTRGIEDSDNLFSFTPAEALRVFHPPFGSMYPSSAFGKRSLNLFMDESHFPPTGVILGRAGIRHVRSDEEIEIRLSEKDRLRHLYVVGRTGSGKTNLLKRMASQDVQIPGRGVTVIDPHGDLVDHVLREVHEERLHEVVLIDLARTTALPVLNPLAIDRKDIVKRDRTVQELIGLLRTKVFHEHTGARFEELVRLTLDSMLDPGYPLPASLVEIGRILIDQDAQRRLSELVKNEELKERWAFQETMRRDPEYGGLIHYVTSRFDDIARDRTLCCVLGGAKATIDIENIVSRNGILLVRIPEAVIGKDSADFIGSLILQGLRLAIIRRRESGETQRYHFVYVDEFQNFANTDFHTIVAEARKFNMGFTLANQNLQQLREFRTYTGVHEERLLSAILGNVAHMVAFAVGARDAHELSPYFGISFEEMMRIGRYEALARVVVDGYETTPFTLRGGEEVRRDNPRALQIIEENMLKHCVDPDVELKEVRSRMGRLKNTKEPSSEYFDLSSFLEPEKRAARRERGQPKGSSPK
jgi:hypothetical protein